jgi:hypothetical protein
VRPAGSEVIRDIGPRGRVPLLVLGFASLFVGVGAGLTRLGWSLPLPSAELSALHGPLMVSAFFGTVISLERAVALARRWAYLGPLLTGLGGAAALLGAPLVLVAALIVAGSAVLLGASLKIYRQQRELFTLTLALGAASWMFGNLLWLAGQPVPALVPWWIAFLVLTIAGERLELSRLLPPSPIAKRVFAALVVALLGGVAASAFVWTAGTLLLGVALAGLALWLMRQDVARHTVKASGLTRFIAVCLLTGYVWLAVAGFSILASGGLGSGGPAYDAVLHAVLLGFVFSMVFAHAPIIFPAVLRVAVPYHPYFYGPLALLHASLAVRLAGDIALSPEWRAWGGALNAIALAAFVLGTIGAVVRGRRQAARS